MCFEPPHAVTWGMVYARPEGRTKYTSSRHPNCSLVKDRTTHPPSEVASRSGTPNRGGNLTAESGYVKWRGPSLRKNLFTAKPATAPYETVSHLTHYLNLYRNGVKGNMALAANSSSNWGP